MNTSNSSLSFPHSLAISSMKSQIFFISSWAVNIASSIVFSATTLALASTIIIASLVPDTVRSISDLSLSSTIGFTINFPSTRPILIDPVGPSNGMFEIDNAIEEPIIAVISGLLS